MFLKGGSGPSPEALVEGVVEGGGGLWQLSLASGGLPCPRRSQPPDLCPLSPGTTMRIGS